MTAPPLSAVGEAARAGDADRFLAALFAPAEEREALLSLIAFNLELAKIPISVSEPMLGEIRLAWWREALEDLFDRGVARSHEALAGLAAAHDRRPLHRASLERMVEGRLFALQPGGGDPFALRAYLADTGGAYMEAAVRALGGGDEAGAVAAKAGFAEAVGRLIAALPSMLAEGGAPFSARPDPAALERGETSDALRAEIGALAKEGLAALQTARAARGSVPRSARAPLLSVHMAERVLKAAAAPGYDPFRVDAPSPVRARAALLLRAVAGRF